MSEPIVVDASVIVDSLVGAARAPAVRAHLAGRTLHAPAHLDAEVLSALGRLQRAEDLQVEAVQERLERLAGAPIERHPLADLLVGAWARLDSMRLVDALYVELAERLGAGLLTTDVRLARAYAGATALSGRGSQPSSRPSR
ncbi:MAG: type II toxin-antitoxin system VapC family toxin [Actinomycetota bacterium]